MMIYDFGKIFIPVLIHFFISNIVVVVAGGFLDAALVTSIAAILTLPIVVWMMRKDQQEYPVKREKQEMPPWTYLLIVVLGVASNQVVSFGMSLFRISENFSNAAQESLFGSALWIQIIGLGILVPIVEEVVFRGLVYTQLKRILNVRWVPLLGAALFALYHGNVVQMIFAFPMALLLIWVYEKWGTIKAPILFHMATNLSAVLLTAFF